MNKIFIVTEANETVATGHLMECIVCAEELIENGYDVSFWINDDTENRLKKRISCKFHEYHRSIENDYESLLEEVRLKSPKVLLFNLREISEDFLRVCRERISEKTAIICIDEFGHRDLSADIIINPMIDSYYWDYGKSKARLFCGAEYLILPKKLAVLHKKKKEIRNCIENIIITMGGVDVKNFTPDLTGIVSEYFPKAKIDLIIGGGNQNREDVIKKAGQYQNVAVSENIPNLLDLLYEADMVICAGGNTLHEAACIGIPAIILPSMPHEERTAKCFEKKGFGITVDTEWKKEMPVIFSRMSSIEVRHAMSVSGKKISDGLGRKRVAEIIDEVN